MLASGHYRRRIVKNRILEEWQMRILFTLLIACVLGVGAAESQTPDIKTLNGGILNGKATSLPKPEYPEGMRLAGIHGTVGVDVVIDETGQVVSAVADPDDQ